MIKYAKTQVVCPFSISGKPKNAVVRYIEENGNILISAPNGCDDMSNSDICLKCMKTLVQDFRNGELKSYYLIE